MSDWSDMELDVLLCLENECQSTQYKYEPIWEEPGWHRVYILYPGEESWIFGGFKFIAPIALCA